MSAQGLSVASAPAATALGEGASAPAPASNDAAPAGGIKGAVPPHYSLKEGDVDPELGKTVQDIIMSTEEFVVYVDTDQYVQWLTVEPYEKPKHRGEVLSRATILEAQSKFITDTATLREVRRIIAEAIAQCLDRQPKEDSLRLLREAEQQIAARNKEVAWQWYFKAAYQVAGVAIAVFILIWALRVPLTSYFGNNAIEIALGALCGPLGSLLSATSRANRLVLDANAGQRIHTFEGLSRIGVGMVGALFVALATKGGLIMGGMHFAGSPLSLMLALCVAAGASERLVPSLVTSFEKAALVPQGHAAG
jgi:hypothetical protein